MSITVTAVDPDSERDLRDVARLWTAYWREVLDPDEPEVPAAEVRDAMHADRDDIDHRIFLARVDGEVVGHANIDIRTGAGNEHMAWVEDVFVLPSHRRRGIGRALFGEIVGVARAAGRTLVLSGYAEGHEGGAAFAAAMGCTTGQRERQNRCKTAELDRAMLEQWVADAAAGAPGYSLVTYDDVCPDDLVDAVVAVKRAMNDAPRTEKLDDFLFTAGHLRANEAERTASKITYWFVGARHDATGEIAGYTQMFLRPDKPWMVEQGDTAVAPAHRGHGIGRWVKAVNALRVLDERPEARVIETWNDGANKWMLAINEAMGFRVAATWVETELELPS